MKLSLFTLLCCITYVAAHGYVQKIAIDGKNYEGDNVNNPSNKPSAIRVTSSVGGVNSVSSPDIACGVNSKPGQLVADAMPGSTVQFSWVTGQGQPGWIHKLGPIIAYLARCENGCSTFDATQGDWFKVFQSGYNNGAWGVAAMNQGQPVSIPLPSTLPPGEYLLRFEFIALHLAMNPGGAEFFVSCAQLKVGGSQSGVIDSSEKVKFPGAYHTNDPGILLDIYTGFSPANYVFPGPSLAKIAGGGGPNGSNGAPTVAPPTGSPVSSPQPSTPVVPQPTTSQPTQPTVSPTGTPVQAPTDDCSDHGDHTHSPSSPAQPTVSVSTPAPVPAPPSTNAPGQPSVVASSPSIPTQSPALKVVPSSNSSSAPATPSSHHHAPGEPCDESVPSSTGAPGAPPTPTSPPALPSLGPVSILQSPSAVPSASSLLPSVSSPSPSPNAQQKVANGSEPCDEGHGHVHKRQMAYKGHARRVSRVMRNVLSQV